MAVHLTYQDNCAILRMDAGENRFTVSFIDEFEKALDDVLQSDSVILVTTGTGKFYSNGLAFDWMMEQTPDVQVKYLEKIMKMCARMLTFPLPTLALMNGHTYAGGAMLALCHDYRWMNEDKGWFCLPEIHLRLAIPTGFMAMLKAKIPNPVTQTDFIAFGKKCNAQSALSMGLIHGKCSMDNLYEKGLAYVREKTALGDDGFDRKTLYTLKKRLYADAVTGLCRPFDPNEFLSPGDYTSKL